MGHSHSTSETNHVNPGDKPVPSPRASRGRRKTTSPSGLSNVHISPQDNEEKKLKGKILIWEGGSAMDIKLTYTGSQEEKKTVAKRGKVSVLSRKARKRMIRFCVSMDMQAMGTPLFKTLTYPGEFPTEQKKIKRDLDAILKAIMRRWPAAAVMWRVESQKRGAADIHLLVWNGPKVNAVEVTFRDTGKRGFVLPRKDPVNEELFEWVSRTWYRIVGSGDEKHLKYGTKVEAIRSLGGIVSYVTKYMSKEQKEGWEGKEWGRLWGVVGRQNVKRHPLFRYNLSEEMFYQVRRSVRKWLEKKTGKKIKTWGRRAGFELNTLNSLWGLKLIGLYGYQEECGKKELRAKQHSDCPF